MPSAAASRKLAGIEQALRFIDDVAPFNIVVVLRIEGNLPAARLRAALDELQNRHPLLQARILAANNEYAFHFGGAGPIPIEICEPADSWVAAAEEELHQRFDLVAGPLMRCRYFQNQSGGHLIIALHHTIVDGASAAHLLSELLSLCACQAAGDAGGSAQEGRFPSSALYPAKYAGTGFVRAAAAFMARQMADEMKFRWRSRGVRKPPIADTGRCHLLPIHFSAKLTAALFEASRRQLITLNSILGAGLMAAVQRQLYPSPRAPLRHITFTDLRPHLRCAVPASELGCHISMFRFTVMVEREGSFWSLARDIQESTLRAARSGERFLSNSMSPKMMKMIVGLKAFRMAATALSYTGPLNLPASHGPFAVTGLHAFTTNFSLGPEYSALVHLFRGALWCDILYLDSDMDSAGAQQIAQDMQAILEEASC
jgi:Condensation domain